MIESILPLISKGGPAAVILAVALGGKWLLEAAKERRSGKTVEATASTNDLATANGLLLKNLEVEREGNAYLRKENAELRQERDDLADEIIVIKRNYEEQLDALKRQLAVIGRQVDALKAQLQNTA